ncbi:hydrolase [Halobacteriales archaeon QS_8_69_26]|nr:MAG: hydrolase [Halobacteriales archaeon QS_8_69_26]
MTVRHDGLSVDWLGYATVRIAGEDAVVYLDPGRYGVLDDYEARDGDLVCVTHDHHYDSDGIERVAAPDATVLVYEDVTPEAIDRDVAPVEDLPYDVDVVGEGASRSFGDLGVEVETYPAYNHEDGPHTDGSGCPYHPRGFGCGYRVTVDGVPAFWPGDSDVLDRHEEVDASLFLPPIGGSFTMDRREAADLAARLDPDLTLPVHYDTFEALETDSGAFAADVAARGVPVVLDEG